MAIVKNSLLGGTAVRDRWLLCIAFALAVALLTFVGAVTSKVITSELVLVGTLKKPL